MTEAPPTVLLLGGTGEARELARLLAARPDVRVVSSLAGRISKPLLPAGEVRIGGFGGAAGLAEWIRREHIAAVVDATHPFAAGITRNARRASEETETPLLTLTRPGWTAGPGDDWHSVDSLTSAAALLPDLGRRVFLTTGRQGLAAFADLAELWFLIRCVDPPESALPIHAEVILARGPYDEAAERTLMAARRIDVLVTKNSGGGLTNGKLRAARTLAIPVVMVDRPPGPGATQQCGTPAEALAWTLRQLDYR